MELTERQKRYVYNLIGIHNPKVELVEYTHHSTVVYIVNEAEGEKYKIKMPRTEGQMTRFFQDKKNGLLN